MDAPAVQYATTSDGVSIAWAEIGRGPPLLYCGPTPFTHVQELTVLLELRFEALMRSFRVITFDARGTGMSERDVVDVSAATLLADAEAVIDAAKIDQCVLLAGAGNLLPFATALQLATKIPERVTHLVLGWPYQSMRDVADTPYAKVGLALAEADWRAYVEAFFLVLSGLDIEDYFVVPIARAAATWADPSVGLLYRRLEEATDLGDLLPLVRQPTLVLMEEQQTFVPTRCAERVAAKIPGARFQTYSHARGQRSHDLLLPFLVMTALSPSRETHVAASGFRTVLFTDIVGHTEMMQRLGDARGREVLREHERITRATLKQYGGTEIKTDGDSFMVSFASVTQAIDCAIALQRAFGAHTASVPEPLHVRVGLNAGEPIEEDGDLFGSTVILASRIAAQAGAGEILIPEPLRHLLSGKSYVYADRGVTTLKGFEDPVRLYEVRWRD
jgi:class 3 adenylate cyclase/pimeloyl-ACP methyl ester carboxylesterase